MTAKRGFPTVPDLSVKERLNRSESLISKPSFKNKPLQNRLHFIVDFDTPSSRTKLFCRNSLVYF